LRELILDTAAKSFISKGFKKTTLTDIAEHLEKRKTFIYHYFANKEDIFKSIVQLEAEMLLDEIRSAFSSQIVSELDKFRMYFSIRVKHMHMAAVRYGMLKSELFILLPLIEEARYQFHLLEIQELEQLLFEGKNKNIFEFKNEELIAKVIVSSLRGLEIPMYVSEEIKYEPNN
jgi:AcrR family transcriptional regulator